MKMGKTAFAFDVGNGFVKAKSDKKEIIAPSSIAKESSIGRSSIMNLMNDEKQYETFQTNLDDGIPYIWGKDIANVVDPDALIPTYTHNNRYTKKRFKLLCSFILSELASDYPDEELTDVVVVTGLPSQEIGTTESEGFKTFLQQKHVITRNDSQKVINVTDVRIVEQPTGTLLNLHMNENGQIHKDLLTNTITVIDFGAGTTILDTFKNLKRLPDKSETYYEGMNDLHRTIAKQLEQKHNVKGLSPSYIDQGFRDENFIAEISDRKKYAFEELAQQVIIDFTDKRLSEIDSTLTNRDSIDQFILTGGGVHIVGDYFKKNFGEDHVTLVEDSQRANVEGFFKLAKTVVAS